MGRAPRLRFGGTTQYPDSLLLTHKIGPHAGQHIAHKIIVADRPDIVTARFLTR
ncbi:dihydroneopterin aldolase [Cutibacterium acnes subsp. acnes]|nr:dihydroneopterin aldolase [Cutibacterium acnes subsp. acnes]